MDVVTRPGQSKCLDELVIAIFSDKLIDRSERGWKLVAADRGIGLDLILPLFLRSRPSLANRVRCFLCDFSLQVNQALQLFFWRYLRVMDDGEGLVTKGLV